MIRVAEDATLRLGRAVKLGFAAGKRELLPPKTVAKETETVQETAVVNA